jgi:hypothetical protein
VTVEYDAIPSMSRDDIDAAVRRNDPEELLVAVLSAVLSGHDRVWAQSICERLSTHPHFNVRGNAILGFGHLARLHKDLDRAGATRAIRAGLDDSNEYVRGQAHSAADDVEVFLGWPSLRTEHT